MLPNYINLAFITFSKRVWLQDENIYILFLQGNKVCLT